MLYSYCCAIRLFVNYWVIEALNYYGKTLKHRNVKLSSNYSPNVSVLTPTIALSECFVDNGYTYLLSVNFFCKQINYLSGYWRGTLFIILSKNHFNQIFIFASGFLINKLKYIAIGAYLLILHYIVVSNLETNVLLIENQSYCV